MSVRVMSNIWETADCRGTKLLLLLAIADHANDDGVCWPGNKHLAKKCRLSERQVKRLLNELIDEDLIKWQSGGEYRGDKRVLQMSPLFLERVSSAAGKGDKQGNPSYKESLKNHRTFSSKSQAPKDEPMSEMARKEMRARERYAKELASQNV